MDTDLHYLVLTWPDGHLPPPQRSARAISSFGRYPGHYRRHVLLPLVLVDSHLRSFLCLNILAKEP